MILRQKILDEEISIDQDDIDYGFDLYMDFKNAGISNPYCLSLKSKIGKEKVFELGERFFNMFPEKLRDKVYNVIECNSLFRLVIDEEHLNSDVSGKVTLDTMEVYCPFFGNITDLYCFVHELTHTLDYENGDTNTRRVFGEVAPQCMERLLDKFLLGLSSEELEYYGLDRKTLEEDIKCRQISTFLSRSNNLVLLNRGRGNKEVNLRYVLAQLYSAYLTDTGIEESVGIISDLIYSVENEKIQDFASKYQCNLSLQELANKSFNEIKCLGKPNLSYLEKQRERKNKSDI